MFVSLVAMSGSVTLTLDSTWRRRMRAVRVSARELLVVLYRSAVGEASRLRFTY